MAKLLGANGQQEGRDVCGAHDGRDLPLHGLHPPQRLLWVRIERYLAYAVEAHPHRPLGGSEGGEVGVCGGFGVGESEGAVAGFHPLSSGGQKGGLQAGEGSESGTALLPVALFVSWPDKISGEAERQKGRKAEVLCQHTTMSRTSKNGH